MTIHKSTSAAILIATDEVARANLVRNILLDEFKAVSVSIDPNLIAQDFKQSLPAVLVLAFASLEQSDRYYQELYRVCTAASQHPHRTLILCNNAELKPVYALCKRDYFNDYMLFWPRPDDPLRLCMAIYHLLHELAAITDNAPSAARFALQSRGLAELETVLEAQITLADQQTEVIAHAFEQLEQTVNTVCDGWSQRLIATALPDAAALRQDIAECFRRASATTLSLTRWRTDFKRAVTPFMTAVRTLNALAGQVQATVLVVDDDELQCKVIATILKAENYRLIFAASGLEALSVLRKTHPDVVLMDVRMPDMDGITATQRLKALPQFAQLPVIMITGHSEKTVVVDSLKAGATGFLVKPFGRETLISKLRDALNTP